jgi:DNA-binding LytR/AlgR family response regulator
VLVVQLGLALAASRLAAGSQPRSPAEASDRRPVPFLERVPSRLGRELIALEAEDHYLRVHTALGSELILARLSDAVAQLEGFDGLQVHRSWWVAADAVAGLVVQNGRLGLQLRNGLIAPVSRTYRGAVRARGWPRA